MKEENWFWRKKYYMIWGYWECKFTVLQNEMVSCKCEDSICSHECLAYYVLVKAVGSSAVDPGLIPDSSQLRQKSGVGQEIANFWFFKTWLLKSNFKMNWQNCQFKSYWHFGKSHVVTIDIIVCNDKGCLLLVLVCITYFCMYWYIPKVCITSIHVYCQWFVLVCIDKMVCVVQNLFGMLCIGVYWNVQTCIAVWVMRVENPSQWVHVFKFCLQFKEKQRPSIFGTFAPRLYNCYIHAPAVCQAHTCWPLSNSKFSKTVFMLRVKTLSVQL